MLLKVDCICVLKKDFNQIYWVVEDINFSVNYVTDQHFNVRFHSETVSLIEAINSACKTRIIDSVEETCMYTA